MGNAGLTLLPASPVQTPATPEQYNDLVNAFTGVFVARDPTTGLEVDGVYDLGDVSNGRFKNLNITGDVIKNGQIINVGVPIGVAFPYFKNMPGVPALPANFAECNGSVISNALSPMNGQTLPNINSAGRFVRGGSTSGVIQTNQNKSHIHTLAAAGFSNHTHPLSGTVANHTHAPGSLQSDTAPDHVHSVSNTSDHDTNVASGGGTGQILQVQTTRNTGGGGTHSHYVTGGVTAGAAPSFSGTSGNPSVNTLTGSTDATSTVAPDESRPDCISAVYVMRIY
jgi:hypothetical protein